MTTVVERTRSLIIRPREVPVYPLPLIRRAIPSDIAAIVTTMGKKLFIDPWEQSVFLEALIYYPSTYFVAVCDGAVGKKNCGRISRAPLQLRGEPALTALGAIAKGPS